MTIIWIDFVIVLVGLFVTIVLFYRFPQLPDSKDSSERYPSISVIIPARNEEKNLPLLLNDLSLQSLPALEIICVDDASEDATAQIALSYNNIKLISILEKPPGWTGKTWACHKGAAAAKGNVMLFLDADVRLGQDGLQRLIQAYMEFGSVISVQPFHNTKEAYEQFSMLFNFVQIAANGTTLPRPLNIGLFGPIIMIAPSDYCKVGGHEAVKSSVVEDVALGENLKKAGIPYQLYIGDETIAYRMYNQGLRCLLQGWVKNIASGATKTPFPLFLMVFFWIASIVSVPLHLVKFIAVSNLPWFFMYSILYIVWVFVLSFLARKVGRFQRWAIVLFPILIPFLLGVFVNSMYRRVFGLKVRWKGRDVGTGGKPCA